MRNMGNIAGNVDDLRSQRDARKNPPQYEAGQGDDTVWNFFEDSNLGTDDSSFRGSDISNEFSFSSSDINSLGTNTNNAQSKEQMAKNLTAQEDEIIKVGITIGKLMFGWSKEMVNAIEKGFTNSDAFFWAVYGRKVLVTGVSISVLGVFISILGMVTNYFGGGFWVIVGGLLTVIVGLLIFSFNYDKAKEVQDNIDISESSDSSQEDIHEYVQEEDIFEDNPWADLNDDFSENSNTSDEEDLFSIWGNLENDEEDISVVEGVYEEDVNIDAAIDNIRDIPAHTQTRAYLFEEYCKVLPLKTPEFARLKPISENSDNFIIFDRILMDAALQVGTKEENLPELLELRENSFIIQIKATRPSGLKEDDIANEIANIYSKDEFGGVEHEGVYATTSSVGSNYIINIFKGENSLITLADAYREVKDFVLDPRNKKPIVIGVNELGKVWKFDAERTYSYIISGKPRTGKSWVAVSLVLQLAMYNSPKEVTFEAFDVKKTSSDFYEMRQYLPHFKGFEGNSKRILSRLRYLTTVEAERRRKILDENGVLNIADLKSKGANVELPYLYIIIDEMVGLKGELSKDEDAEFKDLVNTLVTQMPNLGLRVILIPHRVTNEIISKTTYTLVGFVACVKSDFKEIQNTLEVSKKEFPYNLPNIGDMAIKTGEVNKGSTVFSHGLAITSTNEGNKGIYKFVGSLWNMLEPEDTIIKIEEEYRGSNLSGVNDIVKSGEYIEEGNDEEDFWKDILNS